jgi:hypothetical protein
MILILSLGFIPLAFSIWIFLSPEQKLLEPQVESFLPFYCQRYFYMFLAAFAALFLIICLLRNRKG